MLRPTPLDLASHFRCQKLIGSLYRRAIIAFALLVGPFACESQATLIDRGRGLIYDNVLNITWTQNANLSGEMDWTDAKTWAGNLVYQGFDDWRLPSMGVDYPPIDCSAAAEQECRDNEYGYMYYHNLGGHAGDNLTGSHDPFTDIQSQYLPSTDPGLFPGLVLIFDFSDGSQGIVPDSENYFAWAVRDGDVPSVPEPASVLLFTIGAKG